MHTVFLPITCPTNTIVPARVGQVMAAGLFIRTDMDRFLSYIEYYVPFSWIISARKTQEMHSRDITMWHWV